MSAAFRRAGRKIWSVKVPDLANEGWVDRTTTTRDRLTAQRMQDAIDAVANQHPVPLDILGRLVDKSLGVPLFFSCYAESRGDLRALRAKLSDQDLLPLIDEWHAALRGRVADDTRAHYRAAVHTLVPAGSRFLLSGLTGPRLQQWIDEMAAEVKPGTVRKRCMGMRSFVDWLERRGLLTEDVMRRVDVPAPGPARVKYLDTDDVIQLADALPSPHRELCALLAGTSIDLSTALGLRRRQVHQGSREIRAPGTKTHTRDRTCVVADWAWPYVERLLTGRLPDAKLFEGIADRWIAGDVHRATVERLVQDGYPVFAGYWLRDHRHTWAVRAMRAGMPIDLMARQMGHVDGTLILKVYGKFAPTSAERTKWEQIATAADEARRAAR